MSSAKVVIVDYQLGNLFSVEQACRAVGINGEISGDAQKVKGADAIILPGVGAFGEAISRLRQAGTDRVLKDKIQSGTPIFGVCLGLQLLFSDSEEFGYSEGLDIIKGTTKRFLNNGAGEKVRVPQIAWNRVRPGGKDWQGSPLENVNENEFMYFVHSYYVIPTDSTVILSSTFYSGVEYCSCVMVDNVFATQFHPEKSGQKGLTIYRNWAKQNNLI
jgi:glutamine amidotransferase